MNSQSIQVLQFGTGNFLRGFIEPLIEELNSQGESLQVCLVQSTDGNTLEGLRAQDYAYEVYVAGRDQGQTIEEFQPITCIKDGLSLPQDSEKFFSFASSLPSSARSFVLSRSFENIINSALELISLM